MKMFLFAAVATMSLASFVLAEELTVTIQKVDAKAGTITYAKFAFKKKDDARYESPRSHDGDHHQRLQDRQRRN